MAEPIRILHVLGGLNRGGAETMIMNLYRNIDRSKVQFDFIIHTKDECDYNNEIKELGGNIYSIPQFNFKNLFLYHKAWEKFFKQHKNYKIIHGHVRSTASIYLKIAKRNSLTTIAHSHNTSSGKGISAIVKNSLQYLIRHSADYFFACSKFAGVWLFGKKICEKENFYILKNAIDIKKFSFNHMIRDAKRKEFQLEDKFVIGHIGRLHPQKNHMFLIEIFKEVHDRNKNAVLMLVGDGELKSQLKKKVDELGLSASVIFTSVRTDIPELLQAMDIFVFPSLFEGLGIVVIEAQAAGLRCVVADTIPMEAFITDLIEVIPLKATIDIWTNKILDYSYRYERINTYEEISGKGYNIIETTKWLEKFYLEKNESR